MTYHDDIEALARELKRIKENSRDYVLASRDIKAVDAEVLSTTERHVVGSGIPVREVTGRQLQLGCGDFGKYGLTDHAARQLCEKVGLPVSYYWKMIEAGLVDLTAENVNRWLQREGLKDRRLIRVADGKIRAVLSDRYRPLDNFDLAFMTMEQARQHEAVVQRCDLTETRMFIKLVVPQYRELLDPGKNPHYRPGTHQFYKTGLQAVDLEGDPVIPGLVVSNSEVGAGAFTVEPFLFQLSCSNGLIAETGLYKIHLGTKLEIGELVFKDDTRKADDEALWLKVRDVINATFKPEVLKALVQRMRDAKDIPIEKPKEVTDTVAKDLRLSDDMKLDLLREFAKEGDTLYGLTSGITRVAQQFENYEDQIRLERHAGILLATQRVPC